MADIDNALLEGLFVRALEVSGPLVDELARRGYDLKQLQPSDPASVLVACARRTVSSRRRSTKARRCASSGESSSRGFGRRFSGAW